MNKLSLKDQLMLALVQQGLTHKDISDLEWNYVDLYKRRIDIKRLEESHPIRCPQLLNQFRCFHKSLREPLYGSVFGVRPDTVRKILKRHV